MHWNTWGDFLAMGGYAFYVWTSFGLTALVVAWEVLALRQRRSRALRGVQQARLLEQVGSEQTP